jgi:ribosomal protein S18 acetylase RimI-like enzyme
LLLQPLAAVTLPAARALFAAELARHPYAERPLELLDAVAAGSAEYRADVMLDGDRVAGAVAYGLVAGASGAGAVYGVCVTPTVRRRGMGARLVAHALGELRTLGARRAFAEVPDDPAALGDVLGLMRAAGFAEEARVPDLVRDGVAMLILRRNIGH